MKLFHRGFNRCFVFPVASLVMLILISITAAKGQDAADDLLRQERQKITGSWRVVDLEVDGRRAMEVDVRKLSVVNGTDGAWSLRVEGKEIARGSSTFGLRENPKTIDFTPESGESKGELYLGIYELGPRVRRLCFAPPGKPRPEAFETQMGDGRIVVTFERQDNPE